MNREPEFNQPASNPTPFDSTEPKLYPWEKGEAVSRLQELLNAHGFRLVVDGDFGGKTETAVRLYQHRHGLRVDGIVGAQTWTSLKKTLEPGTRVLRRGHSGADVRELQGLLQVNGYLIRRDGLFGELTEQAVIGFQKRHHLNPDGWVNAATWALLRGTPLPHRRTPKIKEPNRWW